MDDAHAPLAAARVAYDDPGLHERDLAPAPLEQLQRWYDEVSAGGAVAEPNAVVLATVDADGLPDARTVLLKGLAARGLALYTHHTSAKGRQLAATPAAALVLPWHPVQRQVRLRGPVERLPDAEVEAYFASRPWGSRIGAHASAQSEEAAGREQLEEAWARAAARWPEDGSGGAVPVPPSWGGYRVRPVEVEFWVGRASRLHDRLVYLPTAPVTAAGPPALDDAAAWRVVRRQP
ncbi:MAG: Pyridoxamine 5'-phosphate oxidase [uncultured Quadrisphaera sp.]|uniref:Pyridoxine/pyridoxamine 5'-phosphate oxidase n=1 Tax=uncultured Quadrisphaera sp. TaxID=904978 RepID=A0A6J4PAG0_9ACTN|nr:MAG: Pyridoxamine 5'-phosphate oxidase [uncultured Quadrisphaera sp.]